MKRTLEEALHTLLPHSGITTIHGKYYMRFELATDSQEDKLERIEQATKRGIAIFKNLIGTDETILLIKEWNPDVIDAKRDHQSHLYNILEDCELSHLPGPFAQTYYEEQDGIKIEKIFPEKLACDLLIGKTNLTLTQVTSIIKGIASLDMKVRPSIPQDVYFFSIEKQAGFRIYDDRGCDVWANSLAMLQPLYDQLNAWLLDYNRGEIEEMFKSNKK